MNITYRMLEFWRNFDNARECWIWPLCKDRYGYGQIKVNGKTQKAHRWSYYVFYGDPGDKIVMHKCDNRSCFNPFHLKLGTHTDNMRDMTSKGRHWRQNATQV